ncbi:type VI secretion system tube protein TssD [Dongshaea marina]|uniref:type VI secretion system tube protein TssD n=1 Tax=Dongshaea marina TaxID=2047966 RepID=UPI000D3E8F03|nr:type VI secretion system tube protein TssD [Dongshaea marina]
MALTMYMSVNGKNQGEIKGGCTQAGEKLDKVLVYAFDHNVEIPKDTHTGLPTGQRIHHPLTITKARDVASPKLLKACTSGEQCTVNIDFYDIDTDGTEKKYYSIQLDEAIIVNRNTNTPHTFLEENKPYKDMEQVSFTYSKITETFMDGNIEVMDSWKES